VARVDFHSQVSDKLKYTCRVVRKIFSISEGTEPLKKVVIIGPQGSLEQLDQLLWSFSAEDFVPHTWVGDEAEIFTPVLLSPEFNQESFAHLPHADVFIHLGQEFLPNIEAITSRFERVIEVVSLEEKDLLAGRERFKQYRTMGLELVNHDQKGAS
jgi:DNA polymerase-3 subunit chi